MKKITTLFVSLVLFTLTALAQEPKVISFTTQEIEVEADVFAKALKLEHTGDKNARIVYRVMKGEGSIAKQNGHDIIVFAKQGETLTIRATISLGKGKNLTSVLKVTDGEQPNISSSNFYLDKDLWAATAGNMVKRSGFNFVENDPKLPNVLLIGTSISIGYTPIIRELMQGKANVYRIPSNSNNTDNGVRKMDAWLSSMKWDVIHMNFGLHDLKYVVSQERRDVETEDYQKNLKKIIEIIQEKTDATIVWATTSYYPEGCSPRRDVGDDALYNKLADEVIKQFKGIIVDDQYALTKSKYPEGQLPNNVHFKPEGYRWQAIQASAAIEKALKGTSKR